MKLLLKEREYLSRSLLINYRAWKHFLCPTRLVWAFNPLPPSVPIWHRLAKLSILILERIINFFSL